MAKGRIRNRLELRAQAEAAERRQQGEETDVEEEEDEDAEESDEEEAAVADDEEAVADEEEVEEEAPKKKKPAPKTTKAKPRTRTPKVVRLKAFWKVFDNSNKPVAVFDYSKRDEAVKYAEKLTAEKKGGSATFFVQLVKEPMEEKKEA